MDDAKLLEMYRIAYKAAVEYITASPCDPDIYADQWEKYQKYVDAREELNEADGQTYGEEA